MDGSHLLDNLERNLVIVYKKKHASQRLINMYHEVEEEIVSTLKKRKATNQPLYDITIQPLIKAIIKKKVPHLLDSTKKKGFKVSIK